jgi:hypothetical protein
VPRLRSAAAALPVAGAVLLLVLLAAAAASERAHRRAAERVLRDYAAMAATVPSGRNVKLAGPCRAASRANTRAVPAARS